MVDDNIVLVHIRRNGAPKLKIWIKSAPLPKGIGRKKNRKARQHVYNRRRRCSSGNCEAREVPMASAEEIAANMRKSIPAPRTFLNSFGRAAK